MSELRELAEWTGWPTAMALLLLGGGYAFWLLKNRLEHLKEVNGHLEKSWGGRYTCERCGVKVVSPAVGERMPRSFRMSGTFQSLPEGAAIWACVANGEGRKRQYWPQGGPAKIDKQNQTWDARVIWIDGNPGEQREVAVMLVGEDGQALIDYYIKAGEENQRWPSINHLTRDMKECISHKVTFSGEEVV